MCGRGVGDLRAFKGTRYLVRLISEVFKDLPSFLVIFFMIFYIFAVLFYVFDGEKDEREAWDWIIKELANIWVLSFGDFNTEGFDNWQWALFVIATIFLPLMLLNLLIAIVSDTFDRVYQNRVASDYKELAKLVLEQEYLMFWKRSYLNAGSLRLNCSQEILACGQV